MVAVFVSVCVVAPIVEEILFRGLLFRALGRQFALPVAAALSAAVFAGLHPPLPWGFFSLFATGVGLCYLYRATGSLMPCIVAHAVNNTLALLASRALFS